MCYQCTSAQPGCGLYDFNWRGIGYLGTDCPDEDDTCVKIIERKGAMETVTRDCLSNIRATGRTDIPADPYEGCRDAATDVRLGHYVNNSVKEYDIHGTHFDSITYCFCFFDFRCNAAPKLSSMSTILIGIASIATVLVFRAV